MLPRVSRQSASEPQAMQLHGIVGSRVATESQRPLGSLPLVDTKRASGCRI